MFQGPRKPLIVDDRVDRPDQKTVLPRRLAKHGADTLVGYAERTRTRDMMGPFVRRADPNPGPQDDDLGSFRAKSRVLD